MYNLVANWVDQLDFTAISEDVAAFCFNLYDGCDGTHWSMELIGTDCYDPDDSDWACDEVTDFGSREMEFKWTKQAQWNEVLDEMVSVLGEYLKKGKYAPILKEKAAVAVGFTDGDLEILYSK